MAELRLSRLSRVDEPSESRYSSLSKADGSVQLLKAYYFGSADDKFVKTIEDFRQKYNNSGFLDSYKYDKPQLFPTQPEIDKNALQIAFRTSPDSLLSLAAAVAEALPLPNVYKWTIEDICKWLRQYGYPQYQNTFRVNLINGHTLLLLDASALSAINIKDFDHIKHIAYGIRLLFFYQMTKFGRSITLAPEFLMELYKLLRVKTGTKYDATKCTDLWRKMYLIRDRRTQDFREHWEILERWLKFEPEMSRFERIGGVRRYNLYKCKATSVDTEQQPKTATPCKCLPPCECFWTERELREAWTMNIVPVDVAQFSLKQPSVLSVLNTSFPERYRAPTVRTLRRFLKRVE